MTRSSGWKYCPFLASHSTSMERGTTRAVSQIIGSERASAPTCHDTPICGIISNGVFSSS